MCDEAPGVYKEGDIVWVKLAPRWWPGQVRELDSVPAEVKSTLKKDPLVIVQFFDEDSYEFVKNWSNIYPYNCERKDEFIKKGMDAFRAKQSHMEKFPKDVSTAEVKTNGNPNILSSPKFAPERRINYSALFFGETPTKKKDTPKKKSHNKSHNKNDISHITHRRFLGYDDYESFIRIQYPGKDREDPKCSDDELSVASPTPSEEKKYTCTLCKFVTDCLEVIVLHNTSHIQGVYKPLTTSKKPKKSLFKKDKSKKAHKNKPSTSKATTIELSSDEENESGKKRKRKYPSQLKAAKHRKTEEDNPKTSSDIRSDLLAEWEDVSDTEEDFSQDRTLDSSADLNSSLEISDAHDSTQESTNLSEQNLDVTQDNGQLAEETLCEVSFDLEKESALEDGISAESTPHKATCIEVNETKPGSASSDSAKAESIKPIKKSCFDFDEEEEESVGAIIGASTTGRKIPRVIPPTEKRLSIDLSRESPVSPLVISDNEDSHLKVPVQPIEDGASNSNENVGAADSETSNKDDDGQSNSLKEVDTRSGTQSNDENLEATFTELLESTVMPELPDIPNALKCEQNFHCAKTIKFPDKSGSSKLFLDQKLNLPKTCENINVATKLTNPKKRFVKSFEDFEFLQSEQKRIALEEKKDSSKQNIEEKQDSIEQSEVTQPSESKEIKQALIQETNVEHPLSDVHKDSSIESETGSNICSSTKTDENFEIKSDSSSVSTIESAPLTHDMNKLSELESLIEKSPVKFSKLKKQVMSKIQDSKNDAKRNQDFHQYDEALKVRRSSASHRTPRSKILESYRNEQSNIRLSEISHESLKGTEQQSMESESVSMPPTQLEPTGNSTDISQTSTTASSKSPGMNSSIIERTQSPNFGEELEETSQYFFKKKKYSKLSRALSRENEELKLSNEKTEAITSETQNHAAIDEGSISSVSQTSVNTLLCSIPLPEERDLFPEIAKVLDQNNSSKDHALEEMTCSKPEEKLILSDDDSCNDLRNNGADFDTSKKDDARFVEQQTTSEMEKIFSDGNQNPFSEEIERIQTPNITIPSTKPEFSSTSELMMELADGDKSSSADEDTVYSVSKNDNTPTDIYEKNIPVTKDMKLAETIVESNKTEEESTFDVEQSSKSLASSSKLTESTENSSESNITEGIVATVHETVSHDDKMNTLEEKLSEKLGNVDPSDISENIANKNDVPEQLHNTDKKSLSGCLYGTGEQLLDNENLLDTQKKSSVGSSCVLDQQPPAESICNIDEQPALENLFDITERPPVDPPVDILHKINVELLVNTEEQPSLKKLCHTDRKPAEKSDVDEESPAESSHLTAKELSVEDSGKDEQEPSEEKLHDMDEQPSVENLENIDTFPPAGNLHNIDEQSSVENEPDAVEQNLPVDRPHITDEQVSMKSLHGTDEQPHESLHETVEENSVENSHDTYEKPPLGSLHIANDQPSAEGLHERDKEPPVDNLHEIIEHSCLETHEKILESDTAHSKPMQVNIDYTKIHQAEVDQIVETERDNVDQSKKEIVEKKMDEMGDKFNQEPIDCIKMTEPELKQVPGTNDIVELKKEEKSKETDEFIEHKTKENADLSIISESKEVTLDEEKIASQLNIEHSLTNQNIEEVSTKFEEINNTIHFKYAPGKDDMEIDISIQTNLTNFTNNDELSALTTLATVSQLKDNLETGLLMQKSEDHMFDQSSQYQTGSPEVSPTVTIPITNEVQVEVGHKDETDAKVFQPATNFVPPISEIIETVVESNRNNRSSLLKPITDNKDKHESADGDSKIEIQKPEAETKLSTHQFHPVEIEIPSKVRELNESLPPIDKNLTVVSEKDLADGQVEITSSATKNPVTLTSFSLDFPDSNNDRIVSCKESSTEERLETKIGHRNKHKKTHPSTNTLSSSFHASEVMTKGSEFNVFSKRKSKSLLSKTSGILDAVCDLEEHIPPQIVCAKDTLTLNKDLSKVNLDLSEKNSSKLLEAYSQKEMNIGSTSQIYNFQMKMDEKESIMEKSKSPKFIVKSKLKPPAQNVSSKTGKPIILSEKIIKPGTDTEAVSVQKITSKRSYQDVEDIDTFIIQKSKKPLSLDVPKTVPQNNVAPAKTGGKAKILQQTIITAAGEIIQPTMNQPDDSEFDINSMPIVLSDDLLTPESIEKMPIMLSDSLQTESIPTTANITSSTQPQPVKKVIAQQATTILNKTLTQSTVLQSALTRPTPNSKLTKTAPKILQSTTGRLMKHAASVNKGSKYIILPQSATVQETKPILKKTLIKKSQSLIVPASQSSLPEPTGNKIMIVTNQQGQKQRLLLTPSQQKLLTQGSRLTKTIVKGNVVQKSVLTPKLGQTIAVSTVSAGNQVPVKPSSSGLHMAANSGQVATTIGQGTSIGQFAAIKNIKVDMRAAKKVPVQQAPRTTSFTSATKAISQQKTVLLKNQHGQTIRKFQNTDEALLEKQVAEQLQAIKASNLKSQQKQPDILNYKAPKTAIKRSYSKRQSLIEPPKQNVVIANQTNSLSAQSSTETSIPPLAPIAPKRTEPQQPLLQEMKQEQKKLAESERKVEPQRPLNQLVIQDAMGNQTTITEGQILALPSETVDGQPQSYMLVTLDESGNLTPLNSEALMSLDPNLNLGGDLSNMVLQIDQSAAVTQPETTQQAIVQSVMKSEPAIAEKTTIDRRSKEKEPTVIQQSSQTASVKTTTSNASMKSIEMLPQGHQVSSDVGQPIACNVGGEPGQQLIVTGDPLATQKFLESLSEGTTDLANILANAEGGSILIHADGQQILINTDSDNQNLLLSVNTDNAGISESTEGGGNPIFASQPKNKDILAAALAGTDVFQQEQNSVQNKSGQSQLSPNSSLYPINVGNVLEPTLTLSSPIMTPLEVPSTNNKKVADDEADILGHVPKNVDLPITITDPNISQTVSQQHVASLIANELQGNLELPLSMTDTSMSVVTTEMSSPSFVYTLPSFEDSVEIPTKSFNSSMPLLTEESVETTTGYRKERLVSTMKKIQIPRNSNKTDNPSHDKFDLEIESSSSVKIPTVMHSDSLMEEEGLCTLGGEMCTSLSEPPPDMFELDPVNSDSFSERSNGTKNRINQKNTENEGCIMREEISNQDIQVRTSEVTQVNPDSTSAEVAMVNEDSCEIPILPRIVTDLSSEQSVSSTESDKRNMVQHEGHDNT